MEPGLLGTPPACTRLGQGSLRSIANFKEVSFVLVSFVIGMFSEELPTTEGLGQSMGYYLFERFTVWVFLLAPAGPVLCFFCLQRGRFVGADVRLVHTRGTWAGLFFP